MDLLYKHINIHMYDPESRLQAHVSQREICSEVCLHTACLEANVMEYLYRTNGSHLISTLLRLMNLCFELGRGI